MSFTLQILELIGYDDSIRWSNHLIQVFEIVTTDLNEHETLLWHDPRLFSV